MPSAKSRSSSQLCLRCRRVNALALLPVALVEELVERLGLSDDPGLLDLAKSFEDLLIAVGGLELLVVQHEVLAGLPSFSVKST